MSDDTAYEACSRCRGYGMVQGLYDIEDCPECRGDCYVRARDNKGRFTRIKTARQPFDGNQEKAQT